MLASFFEMMQYDFIQRAFVAGLIISICAALIGSSLVLRHQSVIGDGLSHVAFGAVAIAVAFGWAPIEFSIITAIIAAFAILRINDNSKINSDAIIAALSASALAIGTFVVSVKGVNIDLNAYTDMHFEVEDINSKETVAAIQMLKDLEGCGPGHERPRCKGP